MILSFLLIASALFAQDGRTPNQNGTVAGVLRDAAGAPAVGVRVSALARGADVVSDRYTPSTLAYQGKARNLGVDDAARISAWAAGDLEPDLVVVLDVSEEVARARALHPPDRVEREGEGFHAAVRTAYRELASERGWILVDGDGTTDDVADHIWKVVQEHLGPEEH
jgi:dTMP kinase